MTADDSVAEIRMGRNFIRVGDTVRVLPSVPKRRDGFLARVDAIRVTAEGCEFDLYGAPKGRPVAARTVRAGRIQRVAQTRHRDHPGR